MDIITNYEDIGKIAKIKNVMAVYLFRGGFNKLPAYIKIRVFREGMPLIIKDEKFLSRLKFQILDGYLDFKPLITKYTEKIFQHA